LVLLWFTRHQRLGKGIVTAGLLVLTFFGIASVSDPLLRSLESPFPPVLHAIPGGKPSPMPAGVPWIVVLGGGATADVDLPVTSRLSSASLARLTEAVRLYRMLPGSRLILSGGAVYGHAPESDALAEAAGIMGVPARDLLLENRSRDTEEQALLLKTTVGNSPFLLVTSAYHMPRSVAIFRKQGMAPIPAPAAFMAQTPQHSDPTLHLPRASELLRSERALHEYLGLLWYRLSGRL
jgi:uncharacterized SAM-binding protein YcdF (DUF218 family)